MRVKPKLKPKRSFTGSRPFPEILAPGKWDISEYLGHELIPPHASRGGMVLHAPYGPEDIHESIRQHEMAHVRFSPKQCIPARYDVSEIAIKCIEDARVNERAVRIGLDKIRYGGPLNWEFDESTVPNPDRDNRSFALLLSALVAMHCYDRKKELVDFVNTHFTKDVEAQDAEGKPVYDDDGQPVTRKVLTDNAKLCLNAAEHICSTFKNASRPPSFRKTIEMCRYFDQLILDTFGEHDGLKELRSISEQWRRLLESGDEKARQMLTERGNWGALKEVEKPPLEVKFRTVKLFSKYRATEEGSYFRAPHRMMVDKRVFACRKKLPGGSLMVDMSGSMSLSRDDVQAIMETAPASIIAGYSGDAGTGIGKVRILAEKGRRVRDELLSPPCGSGNVIDGPALRYLARLPEPRVWVSDGFVTGVGDAGALNLQDEIIEICRKHNIYRVRDPAEAAEFLRVRVQW